MRVKTFLCFAVPVFMALAPSAFADSFVFTYNKGDRYRFLSTVRETGGFSDERAVASEVLNRIAFETNDVRGGSGRLVGSIETSERRLGESGAALWSKAYPVDYWSDEKGAYTVDPSYFMPMTRNVPYFVKPDYQPGEEWTAPGNEALDLTRISDIQTPVHIPFTARYKYVGPRVKNGAPVRVINAEYDYATDLPVNPRAPRSAVSPVRIVGSFKQTIYWDPQMGQPSSYEERYDYRVAFSNGRVYVINGFAYAELIDAKPMDRSKMQDDLTIDLKNMGIRGVQVENNEKGVTLVVSNIGFAGNSADLSRAEQAKLRFLGDLLKKYPDRDVEIEGHTARVGSEEFCQNLSEQRALAVADYLIAGNYKKKENLVIRGKGSSEPVADNGTEEGRAKNRRVEITILEN